MILHVSGTWILTINFHQLLVTGLPLLLRFLLLRLLVDVALRRDIFLLLIGEAALADIVAESAQTLAAALPAYLR